MALELKSPAFLHESKIPPQYTCEGKDVSPHLQWSGVPDGTKSFALISEDPDAPSKTWVHWVIYNIPAESRELPQGFPHDPVLPDGIRQGINDGGEIGYGGPCPPPGRPHRYYFKLYALDCMLEIEGTATKEKLLTLRTMIAESRQIGIQSILPITTAYTAPGKGKSSIHGLPTVNYGWSIYLGGFGYPCINQPMLQATQPKQIYALAGDPVWAISDAELRNLLQANFVLLDAEAARIIVERNFGELIGIAGIKHHERETSTYSFEESLDGDAKNKMPQRASVNMTEKNAFVQIYDLMTSAQARTVIKDCYNNPLGAGSVTYRNATGGRGLILPYRLPCEFLPHVWARKYWLDRWLEELAGGVTLPFLADAPWVHLSARIGPRQKTLFMANQMFEIYDRLNLYLPDDFASTDWKIEIHSRDKKGRVFVDDGRMTVETELAGNDWLLLVGR